MDGRFDRAVAIGGVGLPQPVAVHWAGVTPYFAERPAIDVLGRAGAAGGADLAAAACGVASSLTWQP